MAKSKQGARKATAAKRAALKTAPAKEKFSRFDPAELLKSEDDMAVYLKACIEEAGDDAAFIAAALGDIARAYGMLKLSKKTGLSREGLYKALAKDGNPSLATVLKVMKALGLKMSAEAA